MFYLIVGQLLKMLQFNFNFFYIINRLSPSLLNKHFCLKKNTQNNSRVLA